MNENAFLLHHIQRPEDRVIVMKVINKAMSVKKSFAPKYTDFLDPYQLSLSIPILQKFHDIRFTIPEKYHDPERNIFLIYPDFLDEKDIECPLQALRIQGDYHNHDISHRDVLGSVLGLGIKREKIGDIIIHDKQVDIVVLSEISNYIEVHLNKISKYPVSIHQISFDEINRKDDKFKVIQTTVQSLRLDAILSSGFGESRTSISRFINHDRVKVNWKPINSGDYLLKEGDIISFQGRGRLILNQVGNKTKSNRFRIVIHRMI
ncbi:MAG: RNA-binding protein [Bacillota bacterium]